MSSLRRIFEAKDDDFPTAEEAEEAFQTQQHSQEERRQKKQID
tara:strand:- start:2716 stop:2844 length:129 start_codon:yes stop_codon:yes gene_type:complete